MTRLYDFAAVCFTPPTDEQKKNILELREVGTNQTSRWSYLQAPFVAIPAAVVALIDIPRLPVVALGKSLKSFSKLEMREGFSTFGLGVGDGLRSVLQVVSIATVVFVGLIPLVRGWVYVKLPMETPEQANAKIEELKKEILSLTEERETTKTAYEQKLATLETKIETEKDLIKQLKEDLKDLNQKLDAAKEKAVFSPEKKKPRRNSASVITTF